jgi:thiol-disulfide isomerase/thioredoxin
MAKVPGLTFRDALEYTTQGKKDAVITVGIIKDGEMSWTVYGENGQELPQQLHTYEIGSLTKTFTAALINKAISEGKVDMNATIDTYLTLPEGKHYPTILALLTHTSGYKGYYFETPMIGNFFGGRNSFCGVTREMVLNKAKSLDMNRDSYGFDYSNYGYAVLGLVLESVYGTDYTALINDYVQNDLGLTSTKISEHDGDLGNHWDWEADDAYLSAGALTSDIADMLTYAQMQLNDPRFTPCHERLKTINASTESYLTILCAEKKKPFLADPKFLKYKGFTVCDEADNGIQLWYLPFSPDVEPPKFKECARHPHTDGNGYVLYYTSQCPFNAKYVPIVEQTAKEHGISFRAIHIETKEAAQAAPTPITTYALFCDGKYLTNEQMNDTKFLKLAGQ